MHTIVDSIAANSAIWVLLCLTLLSTFQIEHVAQELKESYYASQAASILLKAESLGYIDSLAECDGELSSLEITMEKIAQLCPEGSLCTLCLKNDHGEIIKTFGTRDLRVAGYVTIIVSMPTQIVYLIIGVGER
ncbi:MAG: hypothetical protein ACUVTL_00485 [Thermoproteota archaeon]